VAQAARVVELDLEEGEEQVYQRESTTIFTIEVFAHIR
jgi:hypothetical protein